MNPTENPDLEDVLMRWHAGELTLQEEETLAARLMNDPAARRALVFSFMLTGELERRLGLAKKKADAARPARERASFAWLAAGVAVAAAACVLMLYGFGLPGRTPAGLPAIAGGHEAGETKDGGNTAEQDKRIAELIAQLGDDDAEKREAAEKELRALGGAAMAQLEKASADPDAERSNRAKRLVRGLQIGEMLKAADAGVLSAKALHAEALWSNGPYQAFKGPFSQGEPAKYSWNMELIPAEGVRAPNKQSRTVVCDGETVWASLTYTLQGRAPVTTVYKAAYAKMEKAITPKMMTIPLPPTELMKLVREKTDFTGLKSDTRDGKAVWVLDGETTGEGLTMGGGANGAPISTAGARGGGAKRARLILEREGSGTFAAEVLGDGDKILWRVELTQTVLGSGKEGAVYTYQPPEGANIFDMDNGRKQGAQGGANQLQVGGNAAGGNAAGGNAAGGNAAGGNAAGGNPAGNGKDPNANPGK